MSPELLRKLGFLSRSDLGLGSYQGGPAPSNQWPRTALGPRPQSRSLRVSPCSAGSYGATVVAMPWPVVAAWERVRYAETDRMGVAYHSNFLIWFEIGRTTYMREVGYAYRELEAAGYFMPALTFHG